MWYNDKAYEEIKDLKFTEVKKVNKALLVIDMQNVCVGENHATYFKYDNEILIRTVNEVIDATKIPERRELWPCAAVGMVNVRRIVFPDH